MSGRDRPGGTWSNLEPETSWIEDEGEPATVPHDRPAVPEPDGTPTAISTPTGLPVGLRPEPRVNRPAVSVDADFTLKREAPVTETPPPPPPPDPFDVVGWLQAIHRETKRSADADTRSIEIAEWLIDGAWTWLTRGMFAVGAACFLLAFAGMAVLCFVLLFNG